MKIAYCATMSLLDRRWWYLFLLCFLIKLIPGYAGVNGQQFHIPTPQEVVHNAMFIPHGQPLTSSRSTIAQSYYGFSQLIFPFMNFTCRGNITRLIFLARLARSEYSTLSTRAPVEIIWPRFYLWRHNMLSGNRRRYYGMRSIGPVSPDHLVCIDVLDTPNGDYQVGLIEMRLTTSGITFEGGDVLGLQQQTTSDITPTQSSVHVSVLRQRRGYGLTFNCSRGAYECNEPVPDQVNREYYQQMPYIAVETDPEQECAVGFLDEQSLQMIVNVTSARSVDAHPSVYSYNYTQIPQPATSMPLTQSGRLKKLIIAAEFDVTASAGLPELQIIRNVTDVVLTTNTIEPEPTWYLNVYEYDVSTDIVEVKAGDVLSISWRTNEGQPDRNRFSLAYYNGASSEIPIVSIVVGDCDSETNLLTLNSLYCEEDTESIITSGKTSTIGTASTPTFTTSNKFTDDTTNMNQNSSEFKSTVTNAVIGGVISCSLLLLTVITIVMVVVVQRNKKKSLNEEIHSEIQPTSVREVNIDLDINEAYISNSIPTESNIAYSTTAAQNTKPRDYDYIAL